MKVSIVLVVYVLLSAMLFSCEEEISNPDNKFENAKNTYPIYELVVCNFGQPVGFSSFNRDFYFLSEYLSANAYGDISGQGSMVYFDLNFSGTDINSGTYMFDGSGSREPFTITDVEVYFDYNFNYPLTETFIEADSAWLTITGNSELLIDFMVFYNKKDTLVGHYEGAFTLHEVLSTMSQSSVAFKAK